MIDLRLEKVGVDLDAIGPVAKNELDIAVRSTAFRVQASAAIGAPVDTGALRNSIFVRTRDVDGETSAKALAQTKRFGETLEWVDHPAVENPLEAMVAVGVEYGLYVEYGYFVRRNTERTTIGYGQTGNMLLPVSRIKGQQPGTFVAGRYYMTSAFNANRAYFYSAVAKALAKAGL